MKIIVVGGLGALGIAANRVMMKLGELGHEVELMAPYDSSPFEPEPMMITAPEIHCMPDLIAMTGREARRERRKRNRKAKK